MNLGPKTSVKQRGLELVRALFSSACRTKFPGYRTLVTHHQWTDLLATYRKALRAAPTSELQRRGEEAVTGAKADLLRTLFGQKSAAAGDSFLRLLGPLVEASGSADAFSLRFTLHPGEILALEYLRRAGRKRAVPLAAVQEALRHAGYLSAEAEALVGVLTDRGLVVAVGGGLRPVVEDCAEREQAIREIDALSARLARLLGAAEVPKAPESQSLRDLWAHLDHLRQLLQNALAALSQQVEHQEERLREMLGRVRAETIPIDWMKSDLAAHFRGIAKLLARSRDGLIRGLERESGRIDNEIAHAEADGEDWAHDWRRRAPSFERVWAELEQRVEEFLVQTSALRAWLPLNERLASLAELGAKVSGSDPAIARSVRALVADLRERFATGNWVPVLDHQGVATRVGDLESQAQGLLFSRVQAYLGELDFLRVRFNDFLSGPAPQFAGLDTPRPAEDAGPDFARLYAWAGQSFGAAAERLRTRRRRGQAWRHPTRKSQSWADIDRQVSRALAAASTSASFHTVTRLGELLFLMRQGFIAAAADRGEFVYEGAEYAEDLSELEQLLHQGRVRVRVEWLDKVERASDQ
ncbi:MAG: hypothetical protein L0Z62_10255 [Gemmataceae bacterium]|nr:hypothetical protein [Gemmataceae bacterium]